MRTWKPFIVGVDATPAGATAAEFGACVAGAAETRCYLVHATPETWTAVAAAHLPQHIEHIKADLVAQAREQVAASLAGRVSADLLAEMTVGFGRAPEVLRNAARDADAELIILGGKHHSAFGRWFGGSTCHDVIRSATVPVLVTQRLPRPVGRVLVAVDLSGSARHTVDVAERYAYLFDAELRVVSVLEPLPAIPEFPTPSPRDYQALIEEHLEREIWPLIRFPGASTALRHGYAAPCIRQEAADWSADLVVVGSHGKGWFDRVLIGSVTERLLANLPTSLLVVPAERPAVAADRSAETEAGRATSHQPFVQLHDQHHG